MLKNDACIVKRLPMGFGGQQRGKMQANKLFECSFAQLRVDMKHWGSINLIQYHFMRLSHFLHCVKIQAGSGRGGGAIPIIELRSPESDFPIFFKVKKFEN